MRVLTYLCLMTFYCSTLWSDVSLPAAQKQQKKGGAQQSAEQKSPANKIERASLALVSVKQTVSKSAYEDTIAVSKGGFIFDKERGWVITTVGPVGYGASMSSYEITFAGGQKVEAKSLYIDPLYDIQVLVYDAKKLFLPVHQLNVFAKEVHVDEDMLLLNRSDEEAVALPSTVSQLYDHTGVLPKHVLRISLNVPSAKIGGVAINKKGEILGMTLSVSQTFAHVLHRRYLEEVVSALKKSQQPKRMVLKDAVVTSMSLSDAVKYLHFPKKRLEAFLSRYPNAFASGLMVVRAKDTSVLQVGDVVVALNNKSCGPSLSRFQQRLSRESKGTVELSVVRYGKVVKLSCKTLDAWPHVINKMILFGGAMFYEADLMMHLLYEVPLKTLMVSKALPGSVFSGVFSAFPSRDPVSVARIMRFDQTKVENLQDVEKLIPVFSQKPYFSVFYKDYSCAVMGGTLTTNRAPRVGFVDFVASTSIPEKLSWSAAKHEWVVEPIVVEGQSCAVS